ncbi:unnamed protein product, partial [Prorocentrum cordatum]
MERARLETKKKGKEEKEEKDKAGKAQADKGKADSPAGEGKKRAAEEGQAGPDPKKAKTEGQTDPLDWLKPGVEVICSCKLTKDKSKYEGKKGQVVSLVKANTACSVKLLEGSEELANKRHVFVLSQLSPVPGAASSGNAAADSGGAAPPEKGDLFSDPELEKERCRWQSPAAVVGRFPAEAQAVYGASPAPDGSATAAVHADALLLLRGDGGRWSWSAAVPAGRMAPRGTSTAASPRQRARAARHSSPPWRAPRPRRRTRCSTAPASRPPSRSCRAPCPGGWPSRAATTVRTWFCASCSASAEARSARRCRCPRRTASPRPCSPG